MEEAGIIAVATGETDGLAWELGQVVSGGHLAKTFFVFPPVAPDALDRRWAHTTASLAEHGLAVGPLPVPPSLIHTVRLDTDGTASVTYATRRDEATYRTAVDHALDPGNLDPPLLDAAPIVERRRARRARSRPQGNPGEIAPDAPRRRSRARRHGLRRAAHGDVDDRDRPTVRHHGCVTSTVATTVATTPDTAAVTTVATTTTTPATTAPPTTLPVVTSTINGTAVAGNSGGVGPDQTDSFSEAVRNDDGTCSGWAGPGGWRTWTTASRSERPCGSSTARPNQEIGTGSVVSSSFTDVDPGDREQWICNFAFSATVTGTPAVFQVAVANLEPWVARPDPTRPGEFVASVNTVADPALFSQCTDEDFGDAVTEWSAAGQFWSNGISSVCSNGLHIEALDRPCRPPAIGSDHVISVVRFDDRPSCWRTPPDCSSIRRRSSPATPSSCGSRPVVRVADPPDERPTRTRLSTAGRRARRRRSSPTRRRASGDRRWRRSPTLGSVTSDQVKARPSESTPTTADVSPPNITTSPASPPSARPSRRRVSTSQTCSVAFHARRRRRRRRRDRRSGRATRRRRHRGGRCRTGRGCHRRSRPTPGRGPRPRVHRRTDTRRDRAVAQRERRHVDRLAPEADVDRDTGGEPPTVDAVVLDEAARPRRGPRRRRRRPQPHRPVRRCRAIVAPASISPVEVSQTTVAPVLGWYVMR